MKAKEFEKMIAEMGEDPFGDSYYLLGIDNHENVIIVKNRNEILIKKLDSNSFKSFNKKISVDANQTFLTNQQKSLFIRKEGSEETYKLYINDFALDSTYAAYEPKERVFSFLVAKDNSFALVFEINTPTNDGTLYKLYLNKEKQIEKICDLEGFNWLQQMDENKEFVYILNSKNANEGRLLKLNLNTAQIVNVYKEEINNNCYQNLNANNFKLFSSGERALYTRTGHKGLTKEFIALWEVNTKTGKKIRLSPEVMGNVNEFDLTEDENQVVFVVDFAGKRTLYSFDLQLRKLKTLYDKFPILKRNKSFLLNRRTKEIYFISYNNGIMQLNELDIISGEISTLVQSEKAPIEDQVLLEEFILPVEDKTIGVMPGIPCFLYLPKETTNTKLPVFVNFHGGPSEHREALPKSPLFKGTADLVMNYRGSTGYGVTYEKADDGFNRHKQIDDLKYLYEWIKQDPRLDENKIILCGESWGGYMVMATMTRFPDLFYGGFSKNGVSDLTSISTNDYLIGTMRAEIGDTSNPEMLEYQIKNSPCNYGGKIKKTIINSTR
ncbi:alpha/beta hydrolase family protein [Flavobacterium chuncheonense]|uniref:Alpha/beta hydrolase family protein n=1 Tax=Flavobacterium chuncheonense TaxID=2026653 RepID=A0ABW5YKD9_9FLAO